MNIQIVNPITYPDWDQLLLSCRDYSFFHCSSWAKVLHETYHFTPTYFVLFNCKEIVALFPVMEIESCLTGKRGGSLPFTDFSDIIIRDGLTFNDLFEPIKEFAKKHKWKSLEIRCGIGTPILAAPSSIYFRHILHISNDTDAIFTGLSRSTRRNIRIAIKHGIKVEICHSLESVQAFDRLNRITRKRHGLPPQPFSFFKKVYEHLISKNLGFVILAFRGEIPIAGAVYFYIGEKAFWKYGASDQRFHRLKPNNLILWEAIKWFAHRGYKSICFGRTEFENEGLKNFKEGYNVQGMSEPYYRYDFKKNEFINGNREVRTLYREVFKRTPLPLLNMIGSILYRHVG